MADRSIVVRLRAEVGQFKQQMGEAAKATQQIGQQATKSARDNREAWTTAGAALTAYGAGITALGVAVLKTGISYNQLQQTSRAAMTTLLGSAEAANAQMDRLDEFARTSPFAKQVFIQAQQQMIAFGISAQKALPYLDAIQNAVAAMGGDSQQVSEVAFVISQISAAAKITGQDLIQLGQRGINAAELIGSQMGMTGAQVREAITAGSLDAGQALDALAAGMSEKFDGAADNVKNTFAGTMDRVKAAWRDFASEIAAPLVGPNGGGILIDLGNQAADLMRAFQGLPGPVKGTAAAIVAATGVASLLGGAFLLMLPRVIETRAAFAQLATDMPRLAAGAGRVGTALAFVGKAAVGAGAAFATLTMIEQIAKQFDEAHPGMNRTADALLRMSSVAQGFSAIGLDKTFDDLGASVDRVAANSWSDNFLFGMDSAGLRRAKGDIEAIDAALASLVQQEGPEAAAAALESLVTQGYLTRQQLEQMIPLLTGYDDALAAVARSSGDAASASDAVAAASRNEAEALNQAMEAMRAKRSEAARALNAEINYRASIDDARKSLKENGRELNLNTEAGRANMSSLISLAESWNNLSDRQKNAQGSARQARETFVEMATSMGMSEEKARRLAARLLEIKPRNVKVTVDTASAASQLESFIRTASGRTISLGTRVVANSSGVPGGMVARADGGTIPGPRQPYGDKVLAFLAPGEEVITNRRGEADAFRADRAAGRIPAYADGGTVTASMRRGFDLRPDMSAREIRREFREFAKVLKDGGVRLGEGFDAAAKAAEKTAVRWDRVNARTERMADRLGNLRDARSSLVSAAAGSFDNDIFGNGLSGLRLQLEADRNDSRAMLAALKQARAKGLDGGLLEAVAASGDLATMQQLASGSRAQIRQYEQLYNQRSRAQAQLGQFAGEAAFGQSIKELSAELREMRRERRGLARQLNAWERAAERMPNATAKAIRQVVNGNRPALTAGGRRTG